MRLRDRIEPNEICASKLLAVLTDADTPVLQCNLALPALTEEIVKEFESAQQRERLIAEFSSELLCCLNEDRRFLELNVQAETAFGHQSIFLLARTVDSIVLQDDLPLLIAYLDKVRNENQNSVFECRIRKQNGELVDIEWQCEWSKNLECYFCLAKDISDRKENQRLKSEISAMITHDLRAPVTGMSYLLENLEKGIYGDIPEKAQKEISDAQASVERMLSLINQLMNAEKLEGGKMEAKIQVIPLSEVYEHCNSLLSALAAKKDISLVFPESETLVFADYDQLNQILSNLLSNAIKYSPPGSPVSVGEELKNKWLKLSVHDCGPGIPEEIKPVIFERFKCLQEASRKEMASSGLGLYIVKKLIELQGGSIDFSSSAETGTDFWISLKQATEADTI